MRERNGDVHRVWTEQELDEALEGLHAEVRTTDGALERARARLMVAMTEGNRKVTTLTEERTARRTGARRPRRSALRWLVAAAAVAVLTVGALVAQLLPVGSSGGSAEAATLLNRAADAALRAQDVPVQPGQYRYVRTNTKDLAETVYTDKNGEQARFTYLHRKVYELWIPADTSGEWMIRITDDGVEFFHPGDEQIYAEAGLGDSQERRVEVRKARGGDFYGKDAQVFEQLPDGTLVPVQDGIHRDGERVPSWQDPTPEFLAGLPRNPQQLLERIYQDSAGKGQGPDEEAFVYIRDVLRGGAGIVPADLRAALFRAAANIPGMEVVDDAANLDGKRGVAVSLGGATGNRVDLIFDPETGEVIGEREVNTEGEVDNLPKDAVIASSAVTTAVVDEMGVTP